MDHSPPQVHFMRLFPAGRGKGPAVNMVLHLRPGWDDLLRPYLAGEAPHGKCR